LYRNFSISNVDILQQMFKPGSYEDLDPMPLVMEINDTKSSALCAKA